ncbi:hypothetical protein HUU59_05220 [bacterium]|nr:hypothetical protein [bacterium]
MALNLRFGAEIWRGMESAKGKKVRRMKQAMAGMPGTEICCGLKSLLRCGVGRMRLSFRIPQREIITLLAEKL